MKINHQTYHTGLGDQAFAIECNNKDAYDIAEFLFLDFPGAISATTTKQYDIILSGPVPMLSLWKNDSRLYYGKSRYQLAYILMNEIIYHSINTNKSHHALHAGAVFKEDRCIILPGQSGNGKSTLTSWLIMNGFQYLTDELVFLDSKSQLLPMTRPISLKANSSHDSWLLPTEYNKSLITSDTGSMIPHRLFNPLFEAKQPKVTDIIFPEYKVGAEPRLLEISPARSSLYLLQSHVNARNLDGHGVSELAAIVKTCRSFSLTYGNFTDLQKIFHSDSSPF